MDTLKLELYQKFLEQDKKIRDLEKQNRYLKDVLDAHNLGECQVCGEYTSRDFLSEQVCPGCWQESDDIRASDEEDYHQYRSKCTPIVIKGN